MKVQINHIFYDQTDKYKDISVVFRFFVPLTKVNASLVATLLYIMEDRNQHYPTKDQMIAKMDELYGATLTTATTGYGQQLSVQIASKVIHQRFVNQPNLLEQHRQWLETIITKPLINQETLAEAKTEMIAALKRSDEQPSRYAANQAHLAVGADVAFGILTTGDIATIENITLTQVKEFHQSMISAANWIGFIVGNIDLDEYVFWANQLQFKKENQSFTSYYVLDKDVLDDIEEAKKISQSTLIVLLQTNNSMIDEHYLPNRLASIALGQLPTSYLFTEVREKRSLAYSIYSQYISFDGVMMINTGIDPSNADLVTTLIHQQILKLENIDEVLLDQAKNMLVNALITSEDDIIGWINLTTLQALTEQMIDLEMLIEAVKAIDKHQIARAVRKWTPLLTYHLKGEANEANNQSV